MCKYTFLSVPQIVTSINYIRYGDCFPRHLIAVEYNYGNEKCTALDAFSDNARIHWCTKFILLQLSKRSYN